MRLNSEAWLKNLRGLPAGFERGAIPADEARRATAAGLMAGLDLEGPAQLYPWGLEGAQRLWEPWAQARGAVERLAQDPQEPGAQADYLVHDPEAGTLLLGSCAPLPSRCPRFSERACPRMVPMGHESAHTECNYWAWERMAALAPGIELYPEWQRFDCHKYYPLFQLHLCGEALASALKAEPRWRWHGPEEGQKLLAVYASFTSRPEAFEWKPA